MNLRAADGRGDAAFTKHAAERVDDLAGQGQHLDALGADLEGSGLGVRQLAELHDHPGQAGGGQPRLLELCRIGRHDAIDHRLQLRFQHGRGRGEVVCQVARRAAAQAL